MQPLVAAVDERYMLSFLAEFTRNLSQPQTVIVMDQERMEPRQYTVHPRSFILLIVVVVAILAAVLVSVFLFTPLREAIPGYGTVQLRQDARLAQVRVSTLVDSLTTQQLYIEHLRRVLMGDVVASEGDETRDVSAGYITGELAALDGGAPSENWEDHAQPALTVPRMPSSEAPSALPSPAGDRYIAQLVWPALPPVEGFVTRGFDAQTGHFAVDVAVEEGTVVRAIGAGYVIFADWTHEGGYVVTIQHADGFVSSYKHNGGLMKRVGDRVQDREAIAISGNTGEITTGPHVHFELWQHGLAQDPRAFIVGW